jgi:hypothetical protein
MSDSLFWPSCDLRGDTFAVIPATVTSSNGGVSLLQLSIASRQSFCMVRVADVLRFLNSVGQVKFIAQNAAQLCDLVAAAAPDHADRQPFLTAMARRQAARKTLIDAGGPELSVTTSSAVTQLSSG